MTSDYPALDGTDYSVVRRAFIELVHEQWFDRADDSVARAAKIVIGQYSPGIDAAELKARSEPLLKAAQVSDD